MLQAFRNIFSIPELRNKLAFTAGFLLLYRIGSIIPLPGIDTNKLEQMAGQNSGGLGDVFQYMSMLTGGSLSQCTLFALGIMPYISASIIFSSCR